MGSGTENNKILLSESNLSLIKRKTMIQESSIEAAKEEAVYVNRPTEYSFENDDHIRIAYEFIDVQTKTKNVSGRSQQGLLQWRTQVRCWSGFKISQEDFEVAVCLHPDVRGTYPYYTMSNKLVLPCALRINHFYNPVNWGFKFEDSVHPYHSEETVDEFLHKKISSL